MFSKPPLKIRDYIDSNIINELSKLQFKFAHLYIGTVQLKDATFSAYSLATLMYQQPEDVLKQIREGMKIINGDMLKDMDEQTYRDLILYSVSICSGYRRYQI